MYIKLIKKNEDKVFVWYKFETNINTSEGEPKTVYGLVKFNKIEETNMDSLEMIKEETDDLYHNYKRIKNCILFLLYQCKKNNEYPNKDEGAFGG